MEITPVRREVLYTWIEKVLTENDKLTAREIAVILHKEGIDAYPMRDSVHPRLTEMCKMCKVKVCGSKLDHVTHKKVSIYCLV